MHGEVSDARLTTGAAVHVFHSLIAYFSTIKPLIVLIVAWLLMKHQEDR
jgi:hypothetical protein